jgi:hypothetical protein
MMNIMAEIYRFLGTALVRPKEVTIVIRCNNEQTASRLEAALAREFAPLTMSGTMGLTRNAIIHGIKIVITTLDASAAK